MPQRFYRAQACRPPCRKIPENHPDGRRKGESEEDDRGAGDKGHGEIADDGISEAEAGKDADEATEGRQHDGFHQKLRQHLFFQRADGKSNADLAGAFRH
ncbi:hypothetical protein D3C78_1145180 [compost metagenome]